MTKTSIIGTAWLGLALVLGAVACSSTDTLLQSQAGTGGASVGGDPGTGGSATSSIIDAGVGGAAGSSGVPGTGGARGTGGVGAGGAVSSTGGAAGAISVPADGGAGIAGAAGGKTSTTATGGSAGKSGTGGSAGGTGGASVDGGAKDAAIDVNPDSGAGVDGAAPQCLSLSGGTCAALVDGCRACPAGTYLNPTRAGCDEAHAWCCTKVAPEVNECTDGGGLCVPSGAECPDGWKRMRTSCGAGVDSTCCQPDSSVCPVNLGGGCTGRDECDCYQVNGCAMITEECYCTQCDGPRVCNCGGGKFVGCASINLSTCDKAKARLLSVCPIPDSSTWDNLCAQTSPCIVKCLNDVASCHDVACTFCVDCSCVDDRFATCVKTCTAALSD